MSDLLNLIDAYAAENAGASHAAIHHGRDSALYAKCSVAMLEARTAVVEAVEKLERDAARYRWLIDQHWVQSEVDWRLIATHQESTIKQLGEAIDAAMEATNGQGT